MNISGLFIRLIIRCKDIKVIMNKQEREIRFIQNSVEEAVLIDHLERNPSGVFKKLMEMIQRSKAD